MKLFSHIFFYFYAFHKFLKLVIANNAANLYIIFCTCSSNSSNNVRWFANVFLPFSLESILFECSLISLIIV